MEPTDLHRLRAEARAAYERGRVRLAVLAGALAIGPTALALSTWPDQLVTLPLFALAFVAIAVAVWRGGELGRGAIAGVIGGSVPVIAMVIASHVSHVCHGGFCLAICVPICALAGMLTGGFLAWRGARAGAARFWTAAGGVGSSIAAMACVPMGLGATIGLLMGLAAAAVPGALFARASD